MNLFIIFVGLITPTLSFKSLLPEQNLLYTYRLRADISASAVSPIGAASGWQLRGRLSAQTYDDFGRIRLRLGDIQTSTNTTTTQLSPEAVHHLQTPWEVGVCFSSIHVEDQPVWVTNVKRAISFNFLMAAPVNGRAETTNMEEPCIYGNCLSIYTSYGKRIRKYMAAWTRRSRTTSYEARCTPTRPPEWHRETSSEPQLNSLMTSERDYYLDEKIGLQTLEIRNSFQYKTHGHILGVNTNISIKYESSKPVQSIQKLNLTEAPIQYSFHNYSFPSNGIWNKTQIQLKTKTYDMLLKIAKKGIDADNIVRNASLIHNLDFIKLLNTMSQLSYESLSKVFEDVLGTSYELETSRNIFLEVLPYVRNEAAARLIKHLVIEQKTKIEDSMLVSLLRKMPFNIVDYNRKLLEDLEAITKLGPEFPAEIRYAGILSFATLVYKTMEVNFDQQYFDDIYDKYLRMYNYCPQYKDRLIWLQGLTNIGRNGVNYLDEIYTDNKKNRHERLWAALASLGIWKGARTDNSFPILMNETEHIQLRIIALHAILSTPLNGRDFFNIHNYVENNTNEQLKKFWYSTLKNLEKNRFYEKYKSASYYIPFLAADLKAPGLHQWATNNVMISQEPSMEGQGPTFQLMTVGGPFNGPPEMVVVEFSSGGDLAFDGALYLITEGVTSNIFRRLQKLNSTINYEYLTNMLKEMKVEIVEPEKIHIDIIIKIYDKTVYATHINQERFDSWNLEDARKSIEDFVRFGSHINQQIVYYPTQMVKDFPTELGTPLRLHSTMVSFTSIRGNLTAPSTTEDLTWRNDLHIRYQGTSIASISTDGIIPSEHTARIQQSVVVHLPIKLDVTVSPATRFLELKWTNPAQNGGIAMHSRTQIASVTRNKKHIYTLSSRNRRRKEEVYSLFFDCENPMSVPEITQHLASNNNFLTALQPAHLILNALRRITSPTAGSCGVILPPTQLETGNKLDMEVKVLEWDWRESMKVGLEFGFGYYKETEEGSKEKYFSIMGLIKLVHDGQNGDFKIVYKLLDHAPGKYNKTLCLSNHHKSVSPFNIDFTQHQAKYKGNIDVHFALGEDADCNSNASISEPISDESGSPDELKIPLKLFVDYEVIPHGDSDREVLLRLAEKYVLKVYRINRSRNLFGNSDLMKIFDRLIDNGSNSPTFDNNATITEKDGEIIMKVNDTEYVDLKTDSLSWFPPRYTTVQMLKKLGYYYECRINEKTEYGGKLVIGDCTSKPRFLVIQPSSNETNVIVYTGEKSFNFDSLNKTNFDQPGDFQINRNGEEIILKLISTGVLVYHQPNETVVLVPQPLMTAVCGACLSRA